MAHIHEKIDFTTSVYVVQDGKVLLHPHKKLGIWAPPGGHIELDEDPTQAALREVLEETGLSIELIGSSPLPTLLNSDTQDLLPPVFVNRHHVNETHEHVDFIYFGKVIGGELKPEEGGKLEWFSKEDIENHSIELLDSIRAHALAAISYFAKK